MPEALEKVLIGGDLSPLSVEERIDYYKRMCNTLSLNPLTQPFSYILFRESDNSPAKLSLYANKSCSEQLRKIHHVSIAKMRREIRDDVCMVEVDVIDKTGRMDTATGVVALYKFYQGKRELLTPREHANAMMKCETKAKRRVTLSLAGLGWLDETELATIPGVRVGEPNGDPTGEIHGTGMPSAPETTRVTRDQARDLKRLAQTAFGYREGEERLRQDLGFEPEESLTLRHLAAHVTVEQYATVMDGYAQVLRQEVEADLPDFPPPAGEGAS